MITTETIKIPYTNDNEVIERELYSRGINPVRWAVVSVDKDDLLISVSFEKN